MAQDAESPPVITIENTQLEVVNSFTYLGSTVSDTLNLDTEISSRIAKAAGVMAKLNKRVWNNSLLSERTKALVYQACVLSTLLYGSESWTAYARQEKCLNSFHLRCLRRLLKIKWQDRVPNTEVLDCAGLQSMPTLLSHRPLQWLGHVHRMEPHRLLREILYGELRDGARRVGQPQLRFRRLQTRHEGHPNQCGHLGGPRQRQGHLAPQSERRGPWCRTDSKKPDGLERSSKKRACRISTHTIYLRLSGVQQRLPFQDRAPQLFKTLYPSTALDHRLSRRGCHYYYY